MDGSRYRLNHRNLQRMKDEINRGLKGSYHGEHVSRIEAIADQAAEKEAECVGKEECRV